MTICGKNVDTLRPCKRSNRDFFWLWSTENTHIPSSPVFLYITRGVLRCLLGFLALWGQKPCGGKNVSCAWHNEETKILTKSRAGKNFNRLGLSPRPIKFQNLHLTRFKVFPLQRYISWSSLTCLLDELLRIFCWFSNCGSWSENFCRLKGEEKILTIYTLTSVCIFSILFSMHFLRCWQGEFVYRSKASFVDNHFLYLCDLNVLFRGDIVRMN